MSEPRIVTVAVRERYHWLASEVLREIAAAQAAGMSEEAIVFKLAAVVGKVEILALIMRLKTTSGEWHRGLNELAAEFHALEAITNCARLYNMGQVET